MNFTNLWTTGITDRPAMPPSRTAFSQQQIQTAYDATNRVAASIRLLRQGLGAQGNMGKCWSEFITAPLPKVEEQLKDLCDQLSLNRGGTGAFAERNPPKLDEK